MKQGAETSKQNRGLLPKNKDKRASVAQVRGFQGQIESKLMTESEREEFLTELKADRKKDLIRRLLVILSVAVILGLTAYVILN